MKIDKIGVITILFSTIPLWFLHTFVMLTDYRNDVITPFFLGDSVDVEITIVWYTNILGNRLSLVLLLWVAYLIAGNYSVTLKKIASIILWFRIFIFFGYLLYYNTVDINYEITFYCIYTPIHVYSSFNTLKPIYRAYIAIIVILTGMFVFKGMDFPSFSFGIVAILTILNVVVFFPMESRE